MYVCMCIYTKETWLWKIFEQPQYHNAGGFKSRTRQRTPRRWRGTCAMLLHTRWNGQATGVFVISNWLPIVRLCTCIYITTCAVDQQSPCTSPGKTRFTGEWGQYAMSMQIRERHDEAILEGTGFYDFIWKGTNNCSVKSAVQCVAVYCSVLECFSCN